MDRLTRALPLAISEMGKREFSALAFRFFDDDPLAREPAADVVEDFILYLERTGIAPHAVVVALFELARCHCADIGPPPLLTLELQRMPVSRLLTMQVARHPGARAIEVAGQVPKTLLSLYPNLKGGDGILLAKRIGGDLVLPLAMAELAMFRRLAQPCDLVNILGAADAANDAAATFHRLVRLGVIVEVRQDGEGAESTAGGSA